MVYNKRFINLSLIFLAMEISPRIRKKHDDQMTKFEEQIKAIKYFCTTADIWTSGPRRAMGVTLPWVKDI